MSPADAAGGPGRPAAADGGERLLLATRNAAKLAELRRLAAGLEVVGLGDFPGAPDVPETELTFEGNALLKARAAAAHAGLPTIAEDSGLCVDALNGMPGVLSARWSGRFGRAAGSLDRANLELLLDQLADVPDDHRGARFVAAVALVLPGGAEHVVGGRMEGHVVREPRGSGGFGYDPIFVAAGQARTNAELSAAEKDAISHRGRAFRAMVERLPGVLAGDDRQAR